MAKRDDLVAEAERLGVKVDRRWGPERLQEAADAARAEQRRPVEPEGPADDAPTVDDGWPQQVAPIVWVDQQGRRYGDYPSAAAGAQEIRDRTG